MGRKNLTEVENEKQQVTEIETVIEQYGEAKARESVLKKELAEENEYIKSYLKNTAKEGAESVSLDSDNYTAILKFRDDSKMNEEKLIEYLKKHKLAKGIVKKKEYIDEKAFEEATYNGIITDEMLADMDSCKDVKITEVLTIKKKKGAK